MSTLIQRWPFYEEAYFCRWLTVRSLQYAEFFPKFNYVRETLSTRSLPARSL